MKIKDTLLLTTCMLLFSIMASAQFTQIAQDIEADGADPTLLDGTKLSYNYDNSTDLLTFQIDVVNISTAQSQAVGVNIMFNITGSSASTFNFWGADNMNPYHKLLTVWVTGTPPSSYTGTIGVADAAGVNSKVYTNKHTGGIGMEVDMSGKTITVQVPRHYIIPESEMPTAGDITMKVAAAVGSNEFWNDDIYNPAGEITITPNVTSVNRVATAEVNLSVYPNPATTSINITYTLQNASNISVEITDITGKVVKVVNQETVQTAGEHKLNLQIADLAKGIYYIKVIANGTPSETRKLIVVS